MRSVECLVAEIIQIATGLPVVKAKHTIVLGYDLLRTVIEWIRSVDGSRHRHLHIRSQHGAIHTLNPFRRNPEYL